MFSTDLLPIYLNDHLAGATAGSGLAHRAAGANKGTEIGEFLRDLAGQVDADRAQLEDVMARLEIARDPVKIGAGWLAEKLGRLKLNGRLLAYSPLSRVIEIEGLMVGVQGKRGLWKTLAAAAPSEPRIADIDFAHLIERADEQLDGLDGLDGHHSRAAELMLAERV
jgi:hypothetical protein